MPRKAPILISSYFDIVIYNESSLCAINTIHTEVHVLAELVWKTARAPGLKSFSSECDTKHYRRNISVILAILLISVKKHERCYSSVTVNTDLNICTEFSVLL